jgi:hypothetical protein
LVCLFDAVTGEPIADKTIGWADAGAVHDTLVYYPGDAPWLYSKQNVPGSYRVVLRRPGYRDWTSTVEAVPRPRGGARGVLTAKLERLGPTASVSNLRRLAALWAEDLLQQPRDALCAGPVVDRR